MDNTGAAPPRSLRLDTAAHVDDMVTAAQSTGRAPSLVLGVVRDGKLVHFAGAGEVPAPDRDRQYRIGSISKTHTAALVLQLRDAGAVALEDPLDRHLPGTSVGAVTLRQLLGHASGMQREPDGEWWERAAGSDIATLVRGLSPDKLSHPPHRRFHYSNLAYGLVGSMLERVTGEPWRELVADRIFRPLGMTRTTYQAEEPFAPGYVVHPWHGTLREEPRHDAGAMAPAGQLWSTVADLAAWAAFLAAPDPAVLAAETVDEMCVPVTISDLESWTSGYGLGLNLTRQGDRVYVGHSGSMPGYVAHLVVHRSSRTGVVAFANSYATPLGKLAVDLLTEVLDREPAPVTPWRPGTTPPPEIAPLTGRWWWMGHEAEVTYDTDTGELVLRVIGLEQFVAWRFTPAGPDRWLCHTGMNDGEWLRVRGDAGGQPTALDIATFAFTRDPWPDI